MTDRFERLFTATYTNGMLVEVLFYPGALEGEDPSDRIQLLIRPAGQEQRGFLMNIDDAETIMLGLELAIDRARKAGVPESPQETPND